jgi:hypothetical protein
LGDLLGLNSKTPKERCPYGSPPDIEIQSETQWTINDTPQTEADVNLCLLIIAQPDACATCPLAEVEPEEPPSELLQYLVRLEGLIAVGAQIPFESQPMLIWNALKLLKIKRDEKNLKDIKEKN